MFLRACRSKFNLRDTQLFEATDLDANRNATGVISCLRTIQRMKPKPGPPVQQRKQGSVSASEDKMVAAASSSVVVSGSGNVFSSAGSASASTTSENQQEHQHARVATHLPAGWGKHHDPTYDQHYYFNDETESTSWVRPFSCFLFLSAALFYARLIFFLFLSFSLSSLTSLPHLPNFFLFLMIWFNFFLHHRCIQKVATVDLQEFPHPLPPLPPPYLLLQLHNLTKQQKKKKRATTTEQQQQVNH